MYKVSEEKFERTIILPQIEQQKRILTEIHEIKHKRYNSESMR